MEPSEEWASEFGNDYHARNWVNWQKRMPFWDRIIKRTGARSVLEFGCGPGWNLSAIRRQYPDVPLIGVEINPQARDIAESCDLVVEKALFYTENVELVFTAGCLIHIPPDHVFDTMRDLVNTSYKYILSIEYEADKEEEIEYRGQAGLLWKRPYGKMYEDLGLTEIDCGPVGPADGFDDCTWRLMSK